MLKQHMLIRLDARRSALACASLVLAAAGCADHPTAPETPPVQCPPARRSWRCCRAPSMTAHRAAPRSHSRDAERAISSCRSSRPRRFPSWTSPVRVRSPALLTLEMSILSWPADLAQFAAFNHGSETGDRARSGCWSHLSDKVVRGIVPPTGLSNQHNGYSPNELRPAAGRRSYSPRPRVINPAFVGVGYRWPVGSRADHANLVWRRRFGAPSPVARYVIT